MASTWLGPCKRQEAHGRTRDGEQAARHEHGDEGVAHDALRLGRALACADAELVSDRITVAEALRRLLADGPGCITAEAIDRLELSIDAAIAALDRLIVTITTDARRPYR